MLVTAQPDLERGLAEWIRGRTRSPLREMVAVASEPGILSLAGGLPAPEFFPAREYADSIEQALLSDPSSLQYGPPFEPLKDHIVELMRVRGVDCSPGEVFLTTGAQQGIDLLAKLFLDPGGQVLTEKVTYTGVGQAVGPLRPRRLTVGTDLDSGMEVDDVLELLEDGARPAFIYTIPDAHNPLGVSMAPWKRARLVEAARQYRVPLIEDDPYGFLSYGGAGGKHPPPMRALDGEWVFYLGTFSKVIAPALRLGWIVLPADLVSRATIVKEASDLECSALTQRAVAGYLDAGHFPGHLERLRGAYRLRRDAMLRALEQFFPESAVWTRPRGGMFVWVELPPEVNCEALLGEAVREERVAFIPGGAFAIAEGCASNCMRLSFSTCTPDAIEEGVRRLGRLLERRIPT